MLGKSIVSRVNENCCFLCQTNSEVTTEDDTSLMDLFQVVISKKYTFQRLLKDETSLMDLFEVLKSIEFPALDKLKCPGVTQNPKRAKYANATKLIVKTNAKSSGMIMYGHSTI